VGRERGTDKEQLTVNSQQATANGQY
jgi:hypothetical protein